MNRIILLVLGFSSFLVSCQKTANDSSPVKATMDGFIVEATLDNNIQKVVMRDNSGRLLEEGFVKNGVKEGVWLTYDPERGIKTLTTYIDGKLNGTYLEFDRQLSMVANTNYLNNQFHGAVTKYKFGRPIEIFNYKNGQLDGFYRSYFENTGKIQVEAAYKNGKQDGIMRYYNTNEELIMEYVYKNGEKVSGEAVTPKESTQAQ